MRTWHNDRVSFVRLPAVNSRDDDSREQRRLPIRLTRLLWIRLVTIMVVGLDMQGLEKPSNAMKSRFVADGQSRLRQTEAFRARLNELRESIRTRHALELSNAGFVRRCLVRTAMALEFWRERRHLGPSPSALYIGRGPFRA